MSSFSIGSVGKGRRWPYPMEKLTTTASKAHAERAQTGLNSSDEIHLYISGLVPSGGRYVGKSMIRIASAFFNRDRKYGESRLSACRVVEYIAMKLPGGLDLESMMRQAQEMQEKMGREMKDMTVEAAAGGGAVTVKMRGDFEVVSLTISPDLIKDGDVEMLQDLTVAALNEARRKVEESLKGKLGGMLPPGLM
jgi:DNA-binding YbaB/EbfC family protein